MFTCSFNDFAGILSHKECFRLALCYYKGSNLGAKMEKAKLAALQKMGTFS